MRVQFAKQSRIFTYGTLWCRGQKLTRLLRCVVNIRFSGVGVILTKNCYLLKAFCLEIPVLC